MVHDRNVRQMHNVGVGADQHIGEKERGYRSVWVQGGRLPAWISGGAHGSTVGNRVRQPAMEIAARLDRNKMLSRDKT